jgi:predicted enzyme related to lactoylglutathione lyase
MSETSVKARVGEITWHDLLTSDVEAARRFYGDLLGWEFNAWEGSGDVEYPMIHVGEADHGGIAAIDPARGTPPHWICYVRVGDVDATILRAEQEGGTVLVQPADIPEVGRYGVIADPQGAVIAPFAPAYDSPAPKGTFVWEELHTTDPDAAKRFYGEVFGWQSSDMDMGDLGTYGILGLSEEESVAGVFRKPDDQPGPAYWLTYLAASDVDTSTAKAIELGANQLLEPTSVEGVGRFSILVDPMGAPFGLFQAPPE